MLTSGPPPYYGAYGATGEYFNTRLFESAGGHDEAAFAEGGRLAGRRVVEFITAPNNPDGAMRRRTVERSTAVWDHAYYWPHFTPITAAAGDDERLYRRGDVILFTMCVARGEPPHDRPASASRDG